jgi:formate dehydrogenase subunit beta
MGDIQEEIRGCAKKLLEGGKVDCVIGFEQSEKGRVRPFFAKSTVDADKLVWNGRCVNNLAVYLTENNDKVAVVAKGCDSRSILELVKAKQISRENVSIIGVPCNGMESMVGEVLDNCRVCRYRNPVIYDVLLGERVDEGPGDNYEDVEEMESLSPEERFEFWRGEFRRCVKCFACRNVCPICYCDECVLEGKDPRWISKPREVDEMFLFHLIRAFHTAGFCVDCGACERACPAGIQLRLLYRKVAKDVKEFFGYEAGVDLDKKPPLTKFDLENDEKL